MPSCRSTASTAALVALLAGCGGDKSASEATNALSQFTQAATQMADQAQKMAGGVSAEGSAKPVPPVSYKVLLDYLPKSVGDLTAGEPEGETASAGGWEYSSAKAAFNAKEGGRNAQVTIFDYARISMLTAPYRMMLAMKVNRESTKGYERTVEVDGFPAYEKWEKTGTDSEIAVMVGDRFVVTVNTNGMGEGAARKIVEDMDLKGLAKQTAS